MQWLCLQSLRLRMDTVYFKEPLPKLNYVRLFSCFLYNSWNNLKSEGKVTTANNANEKASLNTILPGHYTLEGIAREIQDVFLEEDVELPTQTNTAVSSLVIQNPDMRLIILDSN